MNRSYYTDAIILNLKPKGENNNSVTLLTPDKGVIYATLYGGPKSKLRSQVSLWHSGKIWLYEVPEKNQIKISDMDVKNYHASFSSNLFKMYAASLAAELAIKTRCGGSFKECFILLQGFLDGMELCDEEESRLGLIRFLWRYFELMGIRPDSKASRAFASQAVSYYNVSENCFTWERDEQSTHLIPVKNEAVQYLAAISEFSPAEVRKIPVNKALYEEIKQFVFFLLEKNLELELNTIKTGMGIL